MHHAEAHGEHEHRSSQQTSCKFNNTPEEAVRKSCVDIDNTHVLIDVDNDHVYDGKCLCRIYDSTYSQNELLLYKVN